MKPYLVLVLCFATIILHAQRPPAQPDKNTLLNQSFWQGSPDIATIKAEIEKGSDPLEMNRNSMDPIVIAINASAPTESVKFLLSQKGVDVNRLTHDGRTYIFWAAVRGNTDLMEFLISKGAKTDLLDSHGSSPLTFAANSGQKNTKVYDLFIANGVDLKKDVSPEGANVLLLAIAQDKDLSLTNYFVSKGLSLNSTDNAGNTAFNYVARTGNIELMNTLLAKGVKYTDNAMLMASQGGGRGNTPAVGVEVFQYLEGLKIKPTAVSANGENALHFIVRKPNQAAVINYFLSKGVDLNKTDNDGNTPFMIASAGNRDLATIALLIPSVKDINQVNKKGVSALAFAVRNNSPEVVGLLIDKGADIHTKDAAGDNLAAYLLQSYNANRGTADFDAKIKLLADKGFDITMPQGNGNTLFHLAIAKEDLSLLKRVATLNVDVNARNKEGLTVLHKAAMTARNDSILKYLLSIGARKDIVTDFKETPFDLAKENEFLTKSNVSLAFLQ